MIYCCVFVNKHFDLQLSILAGKIILVHLKFKILNFSLLLTFKLFPLSTIVTAMVVTFPALKGEREKICTESNTEKEQITY